MNFFYLRMGKCKKKSSSRGFCSGFQWSVERFCCNRAFTGGIRLGVETASEASWSSGDDLAEEAPEDFLRVFRSGLANWSAVANVSSPELLEAEDNESEAPPFPLGRGLGLIMVAGAVEAGKSSTKSGVCFCFCWMATRWFQKSRFERKPPRRLPTSSVPPLPLVDPDRRSHIFLCKLKAFCSEFRPSRLAQLDCLTFTKGS